MVSPTHDEFLLQFTHRQFIVSSLTDLFCFHLLSSENSGIITVGDDVFFVGHSSANAVLFRAIACPGGWHVHSLPVLVRNNYAFC
jgi:hypothetical protein